MGVSGGRCDVSDGEEETKNLLGRRSGTSNGSAMASVIVLRKMVKRMMPPKKELSAQRITYCAESITCHTSRVTCHTSHATPVERDC